jgi:hypothetical protein
VTRDTAGDPGVSITIGKDGARALSPPMVSALDFELYNHTATYSQENPSSPVYQRVLPGRPVRVNGTNGTSDAYDAPTAYDEADYYDGGITVALASAALDDISQDTAIGSQRVSLQCLGVESLLVNANVTVPLMVNPLVSDCISAILDAVGWPAARRAVSTSDTRLVLWWCDDRHPWDALGELMASEGPGSLYVDGDAVFHFENRNYRATTPRCVAAQNAFYDTRGPNVSSSAYDDATPYDEADPYDGAAVVLYFTRLSYDPGYKSIYNRATYPYRVRQLGVLGPIWTYGTTLAPAAGGTTLIIRPSDPFSGAVVPVAGVDYTVAGGTVSVSLSASSGFVAFLTISATSGTPIVSGLQLRAQPWTTAAEATAQNVVDASESIARFSVIPGQLIPRVLSLNGWPEVDQATASAVCDAWVLRYMVQRPAVTIEVRNVDGPHTAAILTRAVSDRVTLHERNTGLAADCWINEITRTVAGVRGSDVRAVLGCEKVDEVSGDLWDAVTTLWDVSHWGA